VETIWTGVATRWTRDTGILLAGFLARRISNKSRHSAKSDFSHKKNDALKRFRAPQLKYTSDDKAHNSANLDHRLTTPFGCFVDSLQVPKRARTLH
jgi:hypothetical protein